MYMYSDIASLNTLIICIMLCSMSQIMFIKQEQTLPVLLFQAKYQGLQGLKMLRLRGNHDERDEKIPGAPGYHALPGILVPEKNSRKLPGVFMFLGRCVSERGRGSAGNMPRPG